MVSHTTWRTASFANRDLRTPSHETELFRKPFPVRQVPMSIWAERAIAPGPKMHRDTGAQRPDFLVSSCRRGKISDFLKLKTI